MAALENSRSVSIDFMGRSYVIERTAFQRRNLNDYTWYGVVPAVHGHAIFVVKDGRTTWGPGPRIAVY